MVTAGKEDTDSGVCFRNMVEFVAGLAFTFTGALIIGTLIAAIANDYPMVLMAATVVLILWLALTRIAHNRIYDVGFLAFKSRPHDIGVACGVLPGAMASALIVEFTDGSSAKLVLVMGLSIGSALVLTLGFIYAVSVGHEERL